MRTKPGWSVVAAIGFVMLVGLAWGQGDIPRLVEKSQGEVKYVSGGVGLEEREYLKSVQSNYNLKLVFAVKTKEYLSDVRVVIQDPKGKTYLNTTSDGPWMLIKVPEGSYIVQATVSGETLAEKRKVGKGLQVINFHWKQ